MGITTDTPGAITLGPGDLTFNGNNVGALKGNATLTFTRRSYTPDYPEAGGPLSGVRYIIEIIPRLTVTMGEFELSKLLMAMPGSTIVGDGEQDAEELTSEIGRLKDADFADAVYTVEPGDGRVLTVTIENAIADVDSDLSAEFGAEADGAYEVTFVGNYSATAPKKAPYKIVRALAD